MLLTPYGAIHGISDVKSVFADRRIVGVEDPDCLHGKDTLGFDMTDVCALSNIGLNFLPRDAVLEKYASDRLISEALALIHFRGNALVPVCVLRLCIGDILYRGLPCSCSGFLCTAAEPPRRSLHRLRPVPRHRTPRPQLRRQAIYDMSLSPPQRILGSRDLGAELFHRVT